MLIDFIRFWSILWPHAPSYIYVFFFLFIVSSFFFFCFFVSFIRSFIDSMLIVKPICWSFHFCLSSSFAWFGCSFVLSRCLSIHVRLLIESIVLVILWIIFIFVSIHVFRTIVFDFVFVRSPTAVCLSQISIPHSGNIFRWKPNE